MNPPKIVVTVPTYNERENIADLLRALLAVEPPVQVLVVDDDSPDGTAAAAASLDDPRVTVLVRKEKRGRGYAGVAGFQAALAQGADLVVEMDADGSHDPRQLPDLLRAAAAADVVIGSRYCPGGRVVGYGLSRKLNSLVANTLARLILGVPPRDATAGYRVFRRRALEGIPLAAMFSPGPSIVEEILFWIYRRGFSVVEVPITFVNRTRGATKIRPLTIVTWIWTLLRVRWRAGWQ